MTLVRTDPATPDLADPGLTADTCYAHAARLLAKAGAALPDLAAPLTNTARQWTELGDRLRDTTPTEPITAGRLRQAGPIADLADLARNHPTAFATATRTALTDAERREQHSRAQADQARNRLRESLTTRDGLANVLHTLADKITTLYPEVPAGALTNDAGDRDPIAIGTTVARLLDKLAADRQLSASRNTAHTEQLSAQRIRAERAEDDLSGQRVEAAHQREQARAQRLRAERAEADEFAQRERAEQAEQAAGDAAAGEAAARADLRSAIATSQRQADELRALRGTARAFEAQVGTLAAKILDRFPDEHRHGESAVDVASRLLDELHELRTTAMEQAEALSDASAAISRISNDTTAQIRQATTDLETVIAARDEARQVANANHAEAVAYADQLARLAAALRDRFPLAWMRLATAGHNMHRGALVDSVVKLLDEHVAWLTLTQRGGPPQPADGELIRVDGKLLEYRYGVGWRPATDHTNQATEAATASPPAWASGLTAAAAQFRTEHAATCRDSDCCDQTPPGRLGPPADAPPLNAVLAQAADRAAKRRHARREF